MDMMIMESLDITAQNVERIGALFPNCLTETIDENGKLKKAINFELLRQGLCGGAVFRDSSFANSPAKINVTEIFKMLALDTRVKVI